MKTFGAAFVGSVLSLVVVGCGGKATEPTGSVSTAAGGASGGGSVGGSSSTAGTSSSGGQGGAAAGAGGTTQLSVGGSNVGTGAGGNPASCCSQSNLGACHASPGQCWSDADCGGGVDAMCIGASFCPCDDPGGLCLPVPGQCGQSSVPSCCTGDLACGAGNECVQNVCKPAPSAGSCWRDQDCMTGETCSGASICPCSHSECPPGPDTPGTCVTPLPTQLCCAPDGTCGAGKECVNTVCVDVPPVGSCWTVADCPGGGPGCSGGEVCGCEANCPPTQKLGSCLKASGGGCPPAEPTSGAPCANVPDGGCEYGDDVRVSCRDVAFCQAGTWDVKLPECAPVLGPGDGGCPFGPTAGGSCTMNGETCDEDGGSICGCGFCAGGDCMQQLTWACVSSPPDPCPPRAPDLGQACSIDPAVQCAYGLCGASSGTLRACVNGVWTDLEEGCLG